MGWRENSNRFSLSKLWLLCLLRIFRCGWCLSGWFLYGCFVSAGFWFVVLCCFWFVVLCCFSVFCLLGFFLLRGCERDVLMPFLSLIYKKLSCKKKINERVLERMLKREYN